MKRGLNKRTLHGFLLFSLVFATSCVDDTYDLSKDIDMTVTVGGNLVTPVISTELITLDDFMELDNESDVKTRDNGDYYFGLNGEESNSYINVSKVFIDETSAKSNSSLMTFDRSLAINDEITQDIENLHPDFQIKNNEVPSDVVDVKETILEGSPLAINIHFPGSTNLKGIWLKSGFEINFPDYYILSEELGKDIYTLKDNTITLSKDLYIPASGKTIYIVCNGLNFEKAPEGEGFIKTDSHSYILFNTVLTTKGKAAVKASDLPVGQEKISFQISCDISMDGMELTNVVAQVDPEIDITVDPVKIENLPDFLSDDQIRLDIENPQVMLHINNFSPATVEINAKIKAYKNNQLTQEIGVGSMYNTAPIYAANGINNICLSTKGYSNSSESNISNVKVDDLSKLLTIIPDRIEITQIETSVLPEYYSIRLGDTYQFNTNYDVDAPLTFGPNLNIVYTDSISDLGSDLEDIEFKEIHALIDATNNIPLQLGLDAKPYDKNGQEITDVDVTINGNIMAGSMANGQNSHLEIIIKSKTNSPIKGLDKILLQLTGTIPDNMGYQTLNKNQTIKFDNIRLKVIDGVTIDLN